MIHKDGNTNVGILCNSIFPIFGINRISVPRQRQSPVRSLLPDREVEICNRFRELRLEQRLKLREAAELFEITIERQKSYEYCRVPISYGLGDRVCNEWNVSQQWLAVGEGPKSPYFLPASWMQCYLPKFYEMSRVYDSLLRTYIEPITAKLRTIEGEFNESSPPLPIGDGRMENARYLSDILGAAIGTKFFHEPNSISVVTEEILTALRGIPRSQINAIRTAVGLILESGQIKDPDVPEAVEIVRKSFGLTEADMPRFMEKLGWKYEAKT